MLSLSRSADAIKGQVIAPDQPEYDKARTVFLGDIDRRPAAIIRPADAADVAAVIALARDTDTALAVRSGGHSPAAHGVVDDGIVLDLSAMRGLEIDAEGRTAWAETGLTAGEYTAAVGEHGLATGFGDAGSVGIGGITLAGGVGFLLRKHGLTIDQLLAAEVVTADGELVRADAEQHPELFWALRGGGGNFGVATRLQFRLHEVDTVVGGMLFLPATPDVLAGFIAEADAAPEELSSIANVMPAPPMPFVPPEHHGRPVVMAMLAYAGDVDAGQRALVPFRALAEPVVDMVEPVPYPKMFHPVDPEYRPVAVQRTLFMDEFDRGAAERILERIDASTAASRVVQLRVLGGAMARVPADATAFAHRSRSILGNVVAMYGSDEEKPVHEAWVTGLADELSGGDPAAYAGFLGDEGRARTRAAYPGATWDRLASVKAEYDPENVFRLNQNVEPAR